MSEKSKNLPITIVPKESIENKEEWLRDWINFCKDEYTTVKARYE